MLMNLLVVCDYLLVALILLPGSNPRSLNANQPRNKNETAEGVESVASLNEFNNFVDSQCPPSSNNVNVDGLNGKCTNECYSDVDCIEDYKCCKHGCSFVCMEPWFPNRVLDWAKSSSLNQILDNPEFSNQNNRLWKSRAPCSTSVLDGLQSLRCPTNYVCRITMDGDEQLNIPNRGECVGTNEQELAAGVAENDNYPEFSTIDAECLHKGEKYKHREKFRKDCNVCVCHNGVVFCGNKPCPGKIGIPAAVSNYGKHKRTPEHEYIDIDSENDTEDTLRSSGSGDEELEEERNEKSHKEGGNIELIDHEDTEVRSEDRDGEQREEVGSGDGDQVHGRDVNDRDNEEVNSGDDDLTATKKPAVTNSRTATKTYKTEVSTSTWKTSTSTPETSTLPTKRSTVAPQTSTLAPKTTTFALETVILAPEARTLPPRVDEKETTASSKVLKIKPTEDIIVLKGSDYETSGLDNYSGNDGEQYSGSIDDGSSDEDEGSTEEVVQPEPIHPDTIVLAKYRPTINQGAGLGFETDGPKIDVVHDGSPPRNFNQESEEKSGNEGSASRGILGGKHGRKISEYFLTTDDEQ